MVTGKCGVMLLAGDLFVHPTGAALSAMGWGLPRRAERIKIPTDG